MMHDVWLVRRIASTGNFVHVLHLISGKLSNTFRKKLFQSQSRVSAGFNKLI